jgi:signal transduction histidine kinase
MEANVLETKAPFSLPLLTLIKEKHILTIFEIATILATEYDLDTMLSKFSSCLTKTLDVAENIILMLREPGNGWLVVRAAQGYDRLALSKIRLAIGEGTCGKVFETGEPCLCSTREAVALAREDLSPENQKILNQSRLNQAEVSSCVCIPLITGKATIGVMMLENIHETRNFTEADLPFLIAVAGLFALSVENAFLKEELQVMETIKEANRLKTELISTLSHEMRTPLTSIKGYSTALLMDDISFDCETKKEFLQIIDQECDILQDLIHDLLESSIIDSGLLKLELQPVRIKILAESVVQDIARRTKEHQFMIDFPDKFPIIDADPHRVMQVFRNLLDNSVKYSPNGGLIVVRGQPFDDEVVISVADQGVGLAPEHVNRLFEVGFRVKSGLIRHVSGSGLGLPICRTIVENHGGRIWAESQLDRGTCLYFSLPRRKFMANT